MIQMHTQKFAGDNQGGNDRLFGGLNNLTKYDLFQ